MRTRVGKHGVEHVVLEILKYITYMSVDEVDQVTATNTKGAGCYMIVSQLPSGTYPTLNHKADVYVFLHLAARKNV